MRKILVSTLSAALIFLVGTSTTSAQGVEFKVVPVELYACSFNEGKDMGDLDKVVDKWSAWADSRGTDDYAAWTLTPYYFGPGANSGFDVIWMGAGTDAVALATRQDELREHGQSLAQEFSEVVDCGAHGNYASINHKAPPRGATPEDTILTLSDCSYLEGSSFEALNEAMAAWASHLNESGSNSGIFHWYPVYGGGGETFSFKWLEAHASLVDLGRDFESYGNGRGFETYNELFGDLIDCDSARVYRANNRRFVQLR